MDIESQATVKKCQNCGENNITRSKFEAKDFPNNKLGEKVGILSVCALCESHFEKREAYLNDILTSKAEKILIVAGPGTGKTHTFQKILEIIPKDKKAIVFTLINNLANDLAKELDSIGNEKIKATTFHGFCKGLLKSAIFLEDVDKDFEYFPELPLLIEEDAQILGFDYLKNNFQESFANLDENTILQFYLNKANYYNSVSHDDSVYRVFKYYEANAEKIPPYEIVIADEYQDFNKLESTFIGLLTDENNTLIVGDDDQALYGFRHASKEFIRNLFNNPDYEKLPLSFCSRCTPAIVEATNHFIDKAKEFGLLNDRIPKDFECYWPDKFLEHSIYPQINVAYCSQPNTAWEFIKTRIEELQKQDKLNGSEKELPFLIIGHQSKFRLNQIRTYLEDNLDENIFCIEPEKENKDLTIEEGYRIIHEEENLNLGWRIILYFDPPDNMSEIILLAHNKNIPLLKLLPKKYTGFYLEKIKKFFEQKEKDSSLETNVENDAEEKKRVRIKLATFNKAKGLSALHTFVVDLNNTTFPKDPENIKEGEICKFIVALTRARNSCSLIAYNWYDIKKQIHRNQPSKFIEMLPPSTLKSVWYKIKKGELISESKSN